MFYVKGRGRKVNIHDDNVFTRCPICGREHAVDIVELFSGGDIDLYSTAVYCPECAEKDSNAILGRAWEKEEAAQGAANTQDGKNETDIDATVSVSSITEKRA